MEETSKMNKKAFTLLELLAVIIIIAILALVTVPTVTSIIKNSRNSTFQDSVHALYKSGVSYHEESAINSSIKLPLVVKFANKKATYYTQNEDKTACETATVTNSNELEYSGQNLEDATLTITKEGTINIAAWNKNDKSCYQITSDSKKVIKLESIKNKAACSIDINAICTSK